MTVKELREQTGLSQQKFGDYFKIPRRTIQNWEIGVSECNQYIIDLMVYKLKNEGKIKTEECNGK
jgi:DNA-binding transcriptional regulator YiaG